MALLLALLRFLTPGEDAGVKLFVVFVVWLIGGYGAPWRPCDVCLNKPCEAMDLEKKDGCKLLT